MTIIHRFTGATLFEDASATMRETVIAAVKARGPHSTLFRSCSRN